MRGTFHGLEIGRTGINMGQLGLDITGHNIANVNTRGFTRQRIVQTAHDPLVGTALVRPVAAAHVGGGTKIQIHDQIRSEFLDRRFRTENTAASYWETRTQELRGLESFFDNVDERTSINASLARFATALSTMADDPVSGAPRKEVQQSALDMVQNFHTIHQGLVELQTNQDRSVAAHVDLINEMAEKLVSLNQSIFRFELTGHVANDLRDARNLLLDDLSSIVDIEYSESFNARANGTTMTVSIGGVNLVNHDSRNVLEAVRTPSAHGVGLQYVKVPTWVATISPDENGNMQRSDWAGYERPLNLSSGNDRGRLRALIDMRDNTDPLRPGIPASIENLNNLVRGLVEHVNRVHREGFNDHPFNPSTDGVNFFCQNAGTVFTSGTDVYIWNDSVNGWVNQADTGEPPTVVFSDPADAPAGATSSFDIMRINISNIRLSAEVMESEYNIAASSERIDRGLAPVDQQRGNNENMNALYALFGMNNLFMNGPPRVAIGSFDDFATSIRTQVGSTTRASRENANNTRNLTLSAENARLSVAGVSLDEEMTHMIRFNHAYNGAARVITAMDDALDRLINGTGRVGL